MVKNTPLSSIWATFSCSVARRFGFQWYVILRATEFCSIDDPYDLPLLYSKQSVFMSINETSCSEKLTTLPPDLFDPDQFSLFLQRPI